MTLLLSDQALFTCGAVRYLYRPARPNERTNRIMVPVTIESIQTYAVVDTGAPYIICAPEVAYQFNFGAEASLYPFSMEVRGHNIHGHIHRLKVRLVAEEGKSIDIDATAFIPIAEEWPPNLPSFIGLNGCMDRMRIAIDPAHEMFHFGPLD